MQLAHWGGRPHLVSASRDCTCRVWDLGDAPPQGGGGAVCEAVLRCHSAPITCMQLLQPPGGGEGEGGSSRVMIASGSQDGCVAVCNATGECVCSWQAHEAEVHTLAHVTQRAAEGGGGPRVALLSSSMDGSACVWSIPRHRGGGAPSCPRGQEGGVGGAPLMLGRQDGGTLSTAAAWDASAGLLLTGGRDGVLRAWSPGSATGV